MQLTFKSWLLAGADVIEVAVNVDGSSPEALEMLEEEEQAHIRQRLQKPEVGTCVRI